MQASGCSAHFALACRCKLDTAIWQDAGMGACVYPQSRLLLCQGLLLRYNGVTREIFGLHSLRAVTHWKLRIVQPRCRLFFSMTIAFPSTTVTSSIFVKGVGLSCVRTLQRWWRAMQWRAKALALMMSQHDRLGQASPLVVLDKNLLEMCLV